MEFGPNGTDSHVCSTVGVEGVEKNLTMGSENQYWTPPTSEFGHLGSEMEFGTPPSIICP